MEVIKKLKEEGLEFDYEFIENESYGDALKKYAKLNIYIKCILYFVAIFKRKIDVTLKRKK